MSVRLVRISVRPELITLRLALALTIRPCPGSAWPTVLLASALTIWPGPGSAWPTVLLTSALTVRPGPGGAWPNVPVVGTPSVRAALLVIRPALIGIRPGWLLTVLNSAETVRPVLGPVWIGPVASIRPARLIVRCVSPVGWPIPAVEGPALAVRPALVAVGASALPVSTLQAIPAAAAHLGLIARRCLAERTHLALAAPVRRRVPAACGVDARSSRIGRREARRERLPGIRRWAR